jgi:hypothetical protein
MLKEKKVSVLIKKYILYVLILEGRGKYLFSCGRKGKVSVLIWNKRKVSILIMKKRESTGSQKEEKGKYLFS